VKENREPCRNFFSFEHGIFEIKELFDTEMLNLAEEERSEGKRFFFLTKVMCESPLF
jgi:hypothetical protein